MRKPLPLTTRHRALADRLVAEGRYADDWEVIDHAMSLLDDQERLREIKLAEMKALIQERLDDVEAGRTYPAEAVFAEVREMIARKRSEGERIAAE